MGTKNTPRSGPVAAFLPGINELYVASLLSFGSNSNRRLYAWPQSCVRIIGLWTLAMISLQVGLHLSSVPFPLPPLLSSANCSHQVIQPLGAMFSRATALSCISSLAYCTCCSYRQPLCKSSCLSALSRCSQMEGLFCNGALLLAPMAWFCCLQWPFSTIKTNFSWLGHRCLLFSVALRSPNTKPEHGQKWQDKGQWL